MQKLINKRSIVIDYLMMIVGTGLLAAAIQCLYDPIGLVTGGFTGLAIVIKAVTERFVPGGIPLWLTNIGLQDYFLAAIFGGVIGGAGMGLILLARSTTGGTELLAVLIQHFVRHYSVVQIMQVLDAMIVLTGLYLFGIKAGMYAIVAIFVTTKVSDGLMEGFKYSKSAFIITDQYEKVAKKILLELDRGATGLYAKGMYSGDEKCMLYCVVSKKQIVELKDIVASVDPDAFVIVSDVREVLGEGFLEYHKN